MAKTPDRRPGPLVEEEIQFELLTGDPATPGHVRYVDQGGGQGAFRFYDKDGIYDPRAGGGLSESQHENLDTQTHNLAETRETVITRSAGKVTEILDRTTDPTPLSIRKVEITRTSGKVSQILVRQYDGSGAEITAKRMTGTVNRTAGKVTSIDWVEGT